MSAVLRIAAAVMLDADGRMLVVRKQGTASFMQPGGKLEPGETPAECLARELEEELAFRIAPAALVPLGRFAAPAANEAGWSVDCDVFRVPDDDDPGSRRAPGIVVQAELAEARWAARPDLEALAAQGRLAPLTRDNLDAFLAR